MAECEHPEDHLQKRFRGELLCLDCYKVVGYWHEGQLVLPMRQCDDSACPTFHLGIRLPRADAES